VDAALGQPHLERSRRHDHYLTGSLTCHDCGRRLIYVTAKGNGGLYEYYVCMGNKSGECRQPHQRLAAIEEGVADAYRRVMLTDAQRDAVRVEVRARLSSLAGEGAEERKEAKVRLNDLASQEKKLLAAHYKDQVSPELFDSEQRRISRERLSAEALIAQLDIQFTGAEAGLEAALDFTRDLHAGYLRVADEVRQLCNQAIFETLVVANEKIVGHTLKQPFRGLSAFLPVDSGTENDKTAAPSSWDGGLSFRSMVEAAGIEPASKDAP
jgi:site-specific DNA recombinase